MKFANVVGLICLAALSGCGSSGGEAGGSTQQNPAGIYTGTIQSTVAGTLTATAISLDSGEFRYVASNSVQATGNLQISGSYLSGSGSLFAPRGMAFAGGVNTATMTISNGSVKTASRISGNISGGGDSGTFNFTYNPIFTRSVTLAALAGSYHSTASSTGSQVLANVSSEGNISGLDPSAAFTGTITQPNASQNAFRIQVIYRPIGQTPVILDGLGFLMDGDSLNSVFNLQLTSSDRQLAVTLVR